jgi:hypothetical protein
MYTWLQVKHLTEQVEALQRALDAVNVRAQREKDSCKQAVAKELDDQTIDAAGLRRLLELKNRELRHIRKLSQFILDQRSEVEG